ncbi:helix-turn-helix domain-containing protein [Pseudomonas aeruginosa]|uniref:helix-turn-helix domain-containing protein n=1 Tax=Pseudomonas aeruginosa TaxID=287 RepID=UPI0009369726|nr:AraC family transcriptional regulator [Pseudomonas aeruginosa]MBG6882797.1 helix-turn-helix transcriptional regulator [Pseudomonas aeruginosa]MBV5858715.1 AraC family transcriptional regulator [Pseudomonas aeruginosa]MCS9081277.1 AraC family transcriptional regulator [Pseudomonas aeruginosa]MCT0697563.1 AraC family transcriptional regulator [Pseudomonas aeruginosa]MCU9207996.1 AraC family transcriptional regulator [Pseudomonas aeruginosa]
MNAISYKEYESEHSGDFWTEASLRKQGFDIRLEHAHWSSAGTALIKLQKNCLVRMLLTPSGLACNGTAHNFGSFDGHAAHRFKPLGQLLFIPHGTEFHLRHGAYQQKSLICMFDPADLGTLAAFHWDWNSRTCEEMLNLQSLYLQATLQRLAEEVAAPGFASELYIECLLTGIALELHREFLRDGGEESGKLNPGQLRLLREMLETSPDGDISLQGLAAACSLPVRQLSTRFKNTTGKTLRRYAAEIRVRKAMALLTDPRLLIKQVAYGAGFQNAAAFTAAFRKEVGLTPEEFRRRRSR